MIPAGTELVLRTNETIDTDRAVPDRIYSAEVDRAILDAEGRSIVPAGSPAQLAVVSSITGGTFGTADLQLALRCSPSGSIIPFASRATGSVPTAATQAPQISGACLWSRYLDGDCLAILWNHPLP